MRNLLALINDVQNRLRSFFSTVASGVIWINDNLLFFFFYMNFTIEEEESGLMHQQELRKIYLKNWQVPELGNTRVYKM